MSKSNVVSASLSDREYEYLDEHDLSPTHLMKSKINELMNNSENPYKYTPSKYLSEGRKLGLVLMLAGALVLVMSTILVTYWMIVVEMSAVKMAMIFSVSWLTGTAIMYYGFREYGKYNDIIYWRGKLKIEEKGEEIEESE